MEVEHSGLIHVVESDSVGIVDTLRCLDRRHVGFHVEEEDLRHLQHDVGLSLPG